MYESLQLDGFMSDKLNQKNEDFLPLKLSFYFKKPIIFDGEYDIYQEFLLYYSSFIYYKKCSAQLVLNSILQGNFERVRIIKIEECSISDPDFQQIVQKLEIYHGSQKIEDAQDQKTREVITELKNTLSFIDVEVYIKKCQYLTTALLDCLKNWDNNSFSEEEMKKYGCGLALNQFNVLRSTTLLQFATTQFFKQLRKLKIKNHPIYSNSPILLSLLLTSRNFTKKTQASIKNEQRQQNQEIDSDDDAELEEADEIHSDVDQDDGKLDKVCSNLQRLSFDYSVCHSFDDLPLNSDYFKKIASISYNAYHKHKDNHNNPNATNNAASNQNHNSNHGGHNGGGSLGNHNNLTKITFQNMYTYSLKQLQTLKLKYCLLESKFFSNIEYMQCVATLQTINFSNCHIDMSQFYSFIINYKLKQLKSLNLRATNVDDQLCSLVSDKTVVSFQLEEIDISKTKSSLEQIELERGIDLCAARLEEEKRIKSSSNYKETVYKRNAFEENDDQYDREQDDINDKGYFEQIDQSQFEESENGEEYQGDNDEIVEKSKENQQENKPQIKPREQQTKHPYYDLLLTYADKNPQITFIDFTGCSNVTTPLLEDLFRHRVINKLNHLNLEGTKVDNNLIDIFKQSLTQEEEGITDFWVSHVHKQYNPLQETDVLEVCDGQFLHKNLKFFSIKECKIIRGFKLVFLFKSIPIINLQVIDVSYCNVFDLTLRELAQHASEKYPNLTKIKMAFVKSSPTGIKALRKLPAKKIVFLDLRSTNFDDETSLVFFSDEKNQLLKTLQFLVVKDCKSLTTTGLEAMIDGLSGLDKAEIYNKRFNVSEQEKKEFEAKVLEKKQKQQLEMKKKIDELKKLYKKQQKEQKKKKRGIEVYPSSKRNQIKEEDIQALIKKQNKKSVKEICENFDVFGLLSDCYQLVTDELFTDFLLKLGHVSKNIYELNLNKMGRLTLNQFDFESDELDTNVFQNLEILNINETRITSNFVKNFLKFWIVSNQEKKNDFKMKNFMVLKCQKAHFLGADVLDVFKHQKNLRNILSKTHFKLELLINELGLKIMDENLHFLSNLKAQETRFVSINIKELNLENNQFISQQGFSTILKSAWMKYILRLNVRNTQFGNTQLEQMSQMMKDKRTQKQFNKLQYIGLRGCVFVSRRGLQILCQMEKLSDDFDLGCICELKMLIDADLMKEIAQSLYCKNMEFFDLSDNGFQQIDKGFKYLCFKGRDVKLKLKIINVSSTWISDKALQSLAVSENFNQLEKVIMKDCKKITERGLSYLVDSRQLMNLDLFYLFSSNTQLLSGRVIDTLKYSDRRKTIREISLVGSLAQDKEMNNIMQEIISHSYKIKAIDIRKTSHIGIAGLSYVYNMIQWNIERNLEKPCSLQVLIIDNARFQEFKARHKYEHYKKATDSLQECFIKEKDNQFASHFQESPQIIAAKKQFKPLSGQMTFEEFQKKCQSIFSELRHKIRGCSKPQKLNEIFTGDFIQNLFLSANNLAKFKYDYFLKRFALNIEDEFIDSLTLCDQKFSIFKEMESPNESNQNQADSNLNIFQFMNKKAGDQKQSLDQDQKFEITFPTFKKQFEYFDIKGNKNLCDNSVCRFFLSTQMVSSLKIINISFTLLSEKVILAICASPFLRQNLQVVYFSKCPKLKVKEALQYLLMTDFKSFKYKPVLSEYHYYIDDEILALMLVKLDGEELKYLNLQSSKISSTGLLLLEKSESNRHLYLLDLQNTGVEASKLDDFMIHEEGENGSPFPQNLRYMWLEGTYNLTDEEMYKLKFWKKFKAENFDFMEMVQSKSRRLSLTLRHLTNIELRPYIFRKSYIQLDIFPYIPHDVLTTLINDQFYKQADQFYDLKYIVVGFRKSHYPALKECFNWFNNPDVEKIMYKYCFRITKLPQDYQDLPILKLTAKTVESQFAEVRESINFDFHSYLCSMSYEDILKINKFVETSHLLKLDFQNTDITGNLFEQLCKSIRGNSNRITEVSLKGIQTIRDEQIISMMFDQEEMDQMQKNLHQIYKRHKTKKMADASKKKEEAKKEIQIQIRKISQYKKFPYLIRLNIQNTKVTQHSLVQILKLTPFNMSFRIEELFEQYTTSEYTKIDDHTIYQLSQSPYLQNFKKLNLENVLCSSNTLGKLMRSPKAINIQEMVLNTTNLSEDAFITMANSTNLPKLDSIKCVKDNLEIRKSYHYIMRAQYLSMNLKTEEIMKSRDVMDTSQFIQATMNSFYMNNVQTLEIHKAKQFMQQIKSLFKLSLFTQYITKVSLHDVDDNIEHKDVWQMISVSKSFPRLTILNVKQLAVKEHLIILLDQKFKPLFDMESLLKDNKSLIDDEVIIFISKMPLLLNSKEIDLSDLSTISVNAWKQFANSKYVVNLNKINFSDGTLLNYKTDNNEALRKYFFYPKSEMAGFGKCFGLFSQNNFFNLEKIDINNNRGLPIEELRLIIESIKKRHVSVKFNFEDIFIQIIDNIKPLLLTQSGIEQGQNNKDEGNLQDLLWSQYIHGLHDLFDTYFLRDREWYNIRHKTLDLTYFQFMRHFRPFQDIFRQIQDLSCIETIKFYDGGFDSIFSSNDNKFLNLKNVKIINLSGEKSLIKDENGYQMKNIMEQRYIKPYIFNVNGFLDNYYMNDRIQSYLLRNDAYIEFQPELKIYLHFITLEQIKNIFDKGDVHFAATVITLLDQFRVQTHGQQENQQTKDENENQQEIKELQEKQDYFIQLLSLSKNFSQITKIDTPLPLSLNSVKQLLNSKVLHIKYDIQKHVTQLEVDEEYFDILIKSRYYRTQHKLVIPKLISQSIEQEKSVQQQGSKANQQKHQDSKPISKFILNPQKLDINKIQKLTQIQVIDNIKDSDFLTNLFSIENVKFNKDLTCDKFLFKELDSDHFEHIFGQEITGMDWTVLMDLLDKNKSIIEGEVYEKLLLNKSACYFLTQLIIPETISEEKASQLISSINKSMKINQHMKQLLVTKLSIKQFPQANQQQTQEANDKEDQMNEIKQFLSSLNNVKEIEFSSKVKFGLNEAQILIKHTSSTALSEMVLSWVIPKLTKPELEKLWDFLSSDKEIPKNLSFISFKSNPYFYSRKALEQQINDLRSNKKTKKALGKEGEIEEEEDEKEVKEGKEEKEDKQNENKEEGEQDEQQSENDEEEEKEGTGEEEDQDQDNKAIQKQIEDLQKNAITEDDLFKFLQHFQGLREVDFTGTNVDIHHLKKLKKLNNAKLMHCYIFKDCKAFTDAIPFIWLIDQENKPWFQLQKYLANLPLETCTNHKQLIKALFTSKFFKKNFKYLDVDFILKGISESNKELIELFSYILKRRYPNIDITSFMQCQPAYMKYFINDHHIEQICRVYGNLLYLQPQLFPGVEYGFNHILQQKNIPTAIRLMYLLNKRFQKKVSASSLSTIYQVALKSEDLKEKQVVNESDDQIEKLLVRLLKQADLKRKNILKKLERAKKIIEKKQDEKSLKVLSIIGKKKIKNNKKDKSVISAQVSELQSKATQKINQEEQQKNKEENEEQQEDDDILQIQQQNKQGADLKLENQNQQKEKNEEEQENDKEKEEGEDDNENEDEEEDEEEEDQDGEDQKDGEGEEGNVDENLEEDQIAEEEANLQDSSFRSANQQIELENENEKSMDYDYINESSFRSSLRQTEQETQRGSPQLTSMKTSKFKSIKEKKNTIKFDYESKIQTRKHTVKNNLVRTYGTQTALKLHKQLINLHILSEGLKNQNMITHVFEKKLKEVEKNIDFLEFELEILRYHKNNFFAQEVNNLFSFFEVLNLGENNHLNIYGLNQYVAEHILPWIKMNKNLNELKDGQKRTQKILNFLNNKDYNEEEDFEMANVLNPDHALDDKMIDHLSYLIEKRLKQLRQIDFCGLNVSDDFAENFSLILSDDIKLQHLTLLDLTNNRRLSPFGLKFLFSSIVNRIPQGFKIILSATSNDAEHLRIQIELLEKSIFKEAIYIIEKQKKEVEKFIKKNKSKLTNPPKQVQRKPTFDDMELEQGGKIQNLQMEIQDLNMPQFSDIYSDENQKREEDQIDQEINVHDYDSVDSEEERRKKLHAGELLFFFLKEKCLDSRIVKKLEKQDDFKKKIERLRNFQLAYRKAIMETGAKNIATDSTDIRLIVQNVVNLGLYSAINIVVRDNWKRHKFTIIFFSILFAPLTLFHLMMVGTYSIYLFIQKNQIELKFRFGKSVKQETKIELDKLVPDNIQNTDFFFDEDVAQIDVLLCRNKDRKTPTDLQRRNGRLICEYLNNPEKINFKETYDKINDHHNKELNMLKYIDFIIAFNFIVFTVFICCVYTFYIIFYYIPQYQPEQSCKNIPVLYDVPFYFTGMVVVMYEAALLQNIEKVIVSKKIFQFKSLFVLFQLYNSFMQRYNLYTDMIFAYNIYYCDKAPDLGLISISILGVHLLLQSFSLFAALFNIFMIKRKMKKKIPVHNTSFINIYTKIALIQDFSGLSSVLDRFSTSSTISLEGFYIPKQLQNVKIPQILLTKFQKVFLEDIPQMAIVLLYNFRFAKSTNLLEWQNLRVLLTTVLSMYNSLNSAWQAHPSIFRTYQMQDYIKFRQDISEIYKVKITQGDDKNFTWLSIPKVISKTLSFNQKYVIKKMSLKNIMKNKKKSKKKEQSEKDGLSSKGPNSVAQSSAVLSDNKSVAGQSEKDIQASQQSIKSRVSANGGGTKASSTKSADKTLKELSSRDFKEKLIQFLLEKEKQNSQN